MTPDDVAARHSAYKAQLREARRARQLASAEQDGLDEDESAPRDWKERLLEVLFEVPPDSFERLARRLLREAGFVSATVTGKSGDGGIDGIGVYRLSLVSFPVFFQCKRYRGSVGAGAIRDFRGAMSGRDDKGLADHDRQLHRRCEAGGDPRWRTARRSHRWRAAVRPVEGTQAGSAHPRPSGRGCRGLAGVLF